MRTTTQKPFKICYEFFIFLPSKSFFRGYTSIWEDFNMFRFFSMALFLFSSFIIMGLAEFMPLNDKTTADIMNRLPILLIPANYVFIIWFIIFLFLIIWLSGFWRNRHQESLLTLNKRTILFISSLILNLACILLWHYESFTWTIIAFIGLLCTISVLYFSYPKTENKLDRRLPISLYFGWIIFSFMFLINYLLTLGEWNGWGISQSLWSVIFLTITTAIGLHFLYHHKDIAFNSVLMWGFVGIAVKNGFDSLFVTTAALFLTGVIGTCFFIFRNTKEEAKIAQ